MSPFFQTIPTPSTLPTTAPPLTLLLTAITGTLILQSVR